MIGLIWVDIGNRALSDGWVKPATEISDIALSSVVGFLNLDTLM
ncbi:hypothetical protein D8808_09625 [Streptococcus gordonii]|uniref:Orf-M n=1 Tax=Streptococcus gordonii TaxID=1302 RepID=P95764_STRGN|nr:Orf-M [Streptococcus gordonii]RSJ53840.1 hypothetical protein D8808_09625 [Streptococcus gordonii]